MKTKTQLSLFTPYMGKELLPNNEYVTYIETSSNNNNIVHKKSATSTISNNIEKSLKNVSKYRIAINDKNLDTDVPVAHGLTWSDDSIDKAFNSYKKMFPECVIVKIPQSLKSMFSSM